MAKPLLHTGEHGLVVASLDIDHSVWVQTRLRKRRCEKIGPGNAPQNLAARACGNAGGEERCSRAVYRAIAATSHLMKCTAGQPSTRKP